MSTFRVIEGDCLSVLATLEAGSVQTCITSPPYFGLRDYGTATWDGGDAECDHRQERSIHDDPTSTLGVPAGGGARRIGDANATVVGKGVYRNECGKCGATRIDSQIGLEETPEQYVANLVAVFREVRRVLRDDGTLWLNLGDSYNNAGSSRNGEGLDGSRRGGATGADGALGYKRRDTRRAWLDAGIKHKDLLGIPWAVAQALRAPYYGGEIKAERDRVWLAATLDAEGSICGFTHVRADDGSTRTGIHVTITNTVERLLNEADRIWPASRVEHENHGEGHYGSRPSWRWVAHGAERKALLMRELYPYMIAKREQARLAYAFFLLSIDAKRLGHSPERDATREKRAWIVDAMSRLNRGEGIDVPSWIGEPPTVEEPGWYLRSDIIWAKPNPMPESVTDRPTKAHEYLFLLSKSSRYFYDADAIREAHARLWDADAIGGSLSNGSERLSDAGRNDGKRERAPEPNPAGRNKRSVWTVATQPFPGSHFAVMPPKLVEPCVLAGSSPQACAECGAPWERVTTTERDFTDRPGHPSRYGDTDTMSAKGYGMPSIAPPRIQTHGWQPTCEHSDGSGRCTVLDPFSGAGTTGVVALRHDRDFIGIELNSTYAQMARDRIYDDGPLLNEEAA